MLHVILYAACGVSCLVDYASEPLHPPYLGYTFMVLRISRVCHCFLSNVALVMSSCFSWDPLRFTAGSSVYRPPSMTPALLKNDLCMVHEPTALSIGSLNVSLSFPMAAWWIMR